MNTVVSVKSTVLALLCFIALFSIVGAANSNSVRLTVSTPDGYNEVVHPDVYFNNTTSFLAQYHHPYWMIITPYAASTAYLENPCLYCSDNGFDWITPTGIINPVAPAPVNFNKSTNFNSDPDLVYDYDNGKFYLYYCYNKPAVCPQVFTYDGTTLSAPVNMTSCYALGSSQGFLYSNHTFYQYYCNVSDYTTYTHPYLITSNDGINGWSSPGQRIELTGIPSNKELWHLNCALDKNNRVIGIISAGDTNTQVDNAVEYISTANNFTDTWVCQPTPIISPTANDFDSYLIYRSCVMPDPNNADAADVYYTCDTLDTQWSLMYGRLQNISGTWQLVDPVRPVVSTTPANESKEINLQNSLQMPFANSYNVSSISSISATVTPKFTETGPYSIPVNGLVAWYKMDGDSPTVLVDSSGNGRNGTLTNVSFTSYGKYNKAAVFNGIDSKATVSGFPSMNDATIIFTLRNLSVYATSGTSRQIVGTGPYDADGSWCIAANSTLNKIAFSTNTSTYFVDQWINQPNFNVGGNFATVCVRYKNSDANGFNDSVEVFANNVCNYIRYNQTNPLTGGTLSFGNGGSYYTNMELDNVIIYSRAISDSERDQIYYDNLQCLQLNAGGGLVDASTSPVSLTLPATTISKLIGSVPDTTVINGVTVRDYQHSVTPFIVSTAFSMITPTTPEAPQTISSAYADSKTANGTTTAHDYGLVSMCLMVIGSVLILGGLQRGIIPIKVVALLAVAIVLISIVFQIGAGLCSLL